jgi:hypothetical protein
VNVVEQAYGGGLNSAAASIGCYEREIPVHVRLFADVRAEWPETYDHINLMDKWLISHTGVGITWVKEERWSLEEECLREQTMPSIVLGLRSCSDKFKIRPQNRFLRQWQPAIDAWARREKVTKIVGFDAGESHRIKEFPSTLWVNRYVLVEWDWYREDCVEAVKRHGLPIPRKSSCFYCPEMQWHEIKELNEAHPELMQRALAMEASNVKMTSAKGLARTMSWKDALVKIDEGKIDELPKRMRRTPCACFDGGEE